MRVCDGPAVAGPAFLRGFAASREKGFVSSLLLHGLIGRIRDAD